MKHIKELENELVKQLCKREGKKKQLNAGEMREIIKIITEDFMIFSRISQLAWFKTLKVKK